MKRENYYIILDLSVDPPENDREAIEKAIQNKKVEWSRLRNHPTKGLQAQKFINMIPDIQKVMLDDSLRKDEADAALEFLEQGRESKISEIDSHIDILMGKGYIAREDIIRLSEIHGISQAEINERISAKQDAKFSRVDQLIGLRMGKGYILENELAKIAKKHSMDPDELRKRVRCPILKEEKEAENLSIRPLDKSIEKTINDNLKIVTSKSLYDFLGVSENTELKQLQEKAAKKKKSLSAIGKKDAVVTAGLTLAGQCLTIFKTNETRIAYDVSRAKAKLASLDSDIHIAAINNKIRHEYFDALINRAIEFGMDRDEAAAYIQDFCQAKKYRIETKPEKSRRAALLSVAAIIAAVVVGAGLWGASAIHGKKSMETEFRRVVQQVENQDEPDQKIKMLEQYLNTHGNNDFTVDARNRIKQIKTQMSATKLAEILKTTDEFIKANDLDQAHDFLTHQVAETADTEHKKTIQQRLDQLSDLIEKRDFEKLTAVSLTGEPDEKIALYQKYLENHPNGKNREQVQSLVNEISNEYFIYISKMLSYHESLKNWEECTRLCQNYIDIYDNSHSDQLKQMLPEYQNKIRNEKIYNTLVEKASRLEPDYLAALGVFKDFQAAYPDATINEKINRQIDLLNEKLAAQKAERATDALRLQLAATQGRFIEKQPGVVLDTRTGLMWHLLDSDAAKAGTCMTYEKSKEYIASLTTGGFTDWRLPTPGELTAILETAPTFPVNGEKSYWTSDSYSAYSDGWQTHVTSLSSGDGDQWETIRKNALECGAVRAVRTP